MTVIANMMAAYQQQEIQVVDGNMQPPAEIQENATLLANGTAGQSKWRCCLKSNAAVLILVWNLCVAIGLEFFSSFPVFPGPSVWTNMMRMSLFGVSALFSSLLSSGWVLS